MKIRDFTPEDLPLLKKMHEDSGLDYKLPEITFVTPEGNTVKHPLFLSLQVVEDDNGVVRLIQGARMQVEMYMWVDKTKWAPPQQKMSLIQRLDRSVRSECWLEGVNEAVCYISPQIKKFVKRVRHWLGYDPPREGWVALSRPTGEKR